MSTTGNSIIDEAARDLRDTLFSESPDVNRFRHNCARRFGFSKAVATRLVYQAVQQINAAMFPAVTTLELIHTEGCNLACAYCFEEDMLGRRKMSPDIARAAIDLLFAYSRDEKLVHIIHFGGEPVLNFSGVRTSTEYAEEKARGHGKSVEFHMTSNGVLIDEAMAEYFARHKTRVLLSIDGLADSHDAYRRDRQGRGTFERTMRALRILKAHQGWTGAKMTVMPSNAHRLFEDVTGLYQLGVNQFLIGPATGVSWSESQMQCLAVETRRIYEWYRGVSRSELRIADFDEPNSNPVHFGCKAARTTIAASVDGQISACAKVLAMSNKMILGKLGDVTYGLTHLRTRLDMVSCTQLRSSCDAAGISHEFEGGCFATNYQATGDMFRPNMQDHVISRTIKPALPYSPSSLYPSMASSPPAGD